MNAIFENIKKAILKYNKEEAERWTREAIKEGIDPLDIFDTLTEAIKQVGDGYNSGALWLPDLIGASSAMARATSVLEQEIKKTGKRRKSVGLVVIGTVFGDIHDIGKTMVATLLTANGFEVIDLGINIKSQQFIEAVRENKPDILAMSALLTTTAPEMRRVIENLKETGMRYKVKVAVGGGAITVEFARAIGADCYAPTAPLAVESFEELIAGK
jgi:corrinoid protein of di/trimethylamine methyltransferase